MTLASGPSVATALTFIHGSDGAPLLSPSDVAEVDFTFLCVALAWLATALVCRGTDTSTRRRMGRYVLVALGGVVFLHTAASGASAQRDVAYGMVLAWLAWEVCRANGVALRASFAVATPEQRRTTWTITSAALTVCLFGGVASAFGRQLLTLAGFDSWLVVGMDQDVALKAATPLALAWMSVMTVLVEQVVLIGAVSRLLAAAGHPAWQIYAIIGAVETLLHGYMGLAALAMGSYAAGHLWIYRRYQAVAPLAAGHALYNTGTALAHAPAPIPSVTKVLLAVAAAIGASKLADIAKQHRRIPTAGLSGDAL
ncbi:hypothetical protein [Streptomyces sp. NPDC094149]|uniref:hypothetical protein n=1 Tax=Streptomyces sp. NPDC094149 TaxID=3155079 RepID=UPI00332D1C48